MTIWSVLGVGRDADRAAIRRAYAQKLRATHPEDDPEGFKALREAYEMALAEVDWRATWGDADDDDDDERAEEMPPDAAAGVPGGDDGSLDDVVWTEIESMPALLALQTPAMPDDADDGGDEIAQIISGREADLAQLRARMAELEAGLRGPWRASDAALEHAFRAMLASPALGEIGVREDIEIWLADLLAETIPYSDAILQQAIETFAWDDERHIRHPAIAAALQRHDEWRIIAALNEHGHDYHAGWRSLTGKPGDLFTWRIDALRPKVKRGASALLGEFGPVSPGLHHSFNTESVERWRAYLAEPRLTVGMLAQVPLLIGLLAWLHYAVTGRAPNVAVLAFAAILSGLSVVATLFGLAPLRRRLRDRADLPRWQVEGWPFAYAATVLLAMLLPGLWPLLIAVPALGIAVWAFVAPGTAPPAQRPLGAGLFLYLGLLLFGGAGLDLLTPAQGFAMIVAAVLLGYLRLAHWSRIDAALTPILGPQREWVILAATILALGLAWAVVAWRSTWAPTAPFYPFVLAILAVAPLVGAPSRDSGSPRWMAIALLSLAVVLALGASAPDRPTGTTSPNAIDVPMASEPVRRDTLLDARDADHALAILADAQPAFSQVAEGNPDFRAVLHDTLLRYYNGKATREATMIAFDGAIDSEYRRRLPLADAGLLVEGQRIRLSMLRTLAKADPAACANEGTKPVDTALLTQSQRDRQAAQVFNVISNPPAPPERLAAEVPIAMGALMGDVAARLKITTPELVARLEGKRDDDRRCAARIALLTALIDNPNVAAVAATLRVNGRKTAGAAR